MRKSIAKSTLKSTYLTLLRHFSLFETGIYIYLFDDSNIIYKIFLYLTTENGVIHN